MRYGALAVLFTENRKVIWSKGGRGAVDGYHPLRIFVLELIFLAMRSKASCVSYHTLPIRHTLAFEKHNNALHTCNQSKVIFIPSI